MERVETTMLALKELEPTQDTHVPGTEKRQWIFQKTGLFDRYLRTLFLLPRKHDERKRYGRQFHQA